MKYTNFTNMDSRFMRTYEPGDRLVRGWTGDINDTGRGVEFTLEALFMRHNADDRPDGQLCPSLSIGDVVVIGESGWSVDVAGFVEVAINPADVILDRTWREVIDDEGR